jgi:hypothetical protein
MIFAGTGQYPPKKGGLKEIYGGFWTEDEAS